MPVLAGHARLPCGHWARLGQPIKNNKRLCEAWVSAAYMASFLDKMTLRPGMEVGPLLACRSGGLVGVWLVQEGITG